MLVTVAIVVVLIALVLKLTGRPKGLPPGPTCYPLIGNAGLFKPSEAVRAHGNLRKKYGDINTLMIFHHQMIIVHGYENIRDILYTHGDLFSDRPNTIINGVFNKHKGMQGIIERLNSKISYTGKERKKERKDRCMDR